MKLSLILLFFAVCAYGEQGFVVDLPPSGTTTPAIAAAPRDTSFKNGKTYFELGATAGFPLGAGVQLGVWNPGGSPVLFRFSAGLGLFAFSGEFQLGYLWDRQGDFKQYFSLNAGKVFTVGAAAPYLLTESETPYLGSEYGFSAYNFFTFSTGVAYAAGRTKKLIPQFKIGISWIF